MDIDDYEKFTVVLLNRTSQTASSTLVLSDTEGRSRSWSDQIPAKGVRRFELTQADTVNMSSKELRMRIQGMATRFGRPLVFKQFPNGAISAMHC